MTIKPAAGVEFPIIFPPHTLSGSYKLKPRGWKTGGGIECL
jgi:hypothetical protein